MFVFTTLFVFSTRTRGALGLVDCGVGGTGNVSGMYGFRHVTGIVGGASPSIITVRRISDVAGQDKRGCILNRVTRHARVRNCFTPTVSCSKKGCKVKLLAGRIPLHLRALPLPKERRTHALVLTRFTSCVCYYARVSLARRSHVGSLRLIGTFASSSAGPLFLTNSVGTRPRSNFVGGLRGSFRVLSGPGRRAFPTPSPGRAVSCVTALGRGTGKFTIVSTGIVGRPVTSSRHPVLIRLHATRGTSGVFHVGPCLRGPMNGNVAIV